jgi:hypothetical protein
MNYHTLIVAPFLEAMDLVLGFIPTLVVGLAILIIGYLLSKVMRDIVHGLLKTIKLDDIIGQTGLKDALGNGGVKLKPSDFLSSLVYYVLLLTVLLVTVKAFGLESVYHLLYKMLAYIPHVVSGLVALVLGMYLAKFVSGFIYMVAQNTGMPSPDTLSDLSRYAVLIFAFVIFIEEVGLGALLVGTTFHILFGAVCLALALNYGLGGKDLASKFLGKGK